MSRILPHGILHFSEFLTTLNRHPDLKRGCLVDTSILFAYAYPNDRFNEASTQLFDFLSEIEVPVYTNVNIRSEFINKYFEVLVPEALNDLYQLSGLKFSEELRAKLASNYATIIPQESQAPLISSTAIRLMIGANF